MLRNDDVRSSASPSQEEEGGESFDNKEGSGADKQEGKRSNKEEVGVSDKKEGGDSDKKEGRGSAKRADEDHEVIEISSSPVARTTRASTAVAATQCKFMTALCHGNVLTSSASPCCIDPNTTEAHKEGQRE